MKQLQIFAGSLFLIFAAYASADTPVEVKLIAAIEEDRGWCLDPGTEPPALEKVVASRVASHRQPAAAAEAGAEAVSAGHPVHQAADEDDVGNGGAD